MEKQEFINYALFQITEVQKTSQFKMEGSLLNHTLAVMPIIG
jgi:hypothetical protein